MRPVSPLPAAEAAVEALIRHQPRVIPRRYLSLHCLHKAPRGYRPFRACDRSGPNFAASGVSGRIPASRPAPPKDSPRRARESKSHRARRRKADQAERKDSFILHKFEALLSWAEFINLNRRVEDDDTDDAKKAADDQDEIGLGQISKAPATRLKLHLDLAPEDVDREALSGISTYPEWDVRTWQPIFRPMSACCHIEH